MDNVVILVGVAFLSRSGMQMPAQLSLFVQVGSVLEQNCPVSQGAISKPHGRELEVVYDGVEDLSELTASAVEMATRARNRNLIVIT